jgi:hypothetical protein
MLTPDDAKFSSITSFVPFSTIPFLAVVTDIHTFNSDSESTITIATRFKISSVSKKPIGGAFSFFWKLKAWILIHVYCCTPFCNCYVAIAVACQLQTTVYWKSIEFWPESWTLLYDTCEYTQNDKSIWHKLTVYLNSHK